MDLSLVRAGAASCELADERQAGIGSCADHRHGSLVQSYLIYGLGWALSFRGFRGFRGKSSVVIRDGSYLYTHTVPSGWLNSRRDYQGRVL